MRSRQADVSLDFSLLNLLSVLLIAWVAGAVAKRIGYPSVLGELAAGIVFGPTLLGLLEPSVSLSILAEIGVFVMMLYIGMEVDHRDLTKASRAGLLAAIGGFVTPFALGYVTTVGFGHASTAAMFVAIAVGVTSLATKSRILIDLNLLGTRIANVLLVGALISDTAALVIFAGVIGVAGVGGGSVATELGMVAGKAVLFFGAAAFLGVKIIPWLGRLLERAGFTERTTNFTLILVVALVFGELAELAGLHSIVGAFIAGLFLREETQRRKLSHEITNLVHDLSIGFLAPIFFVSAGFMVSIDVFRTDLLFMVAIIGLATIGKIVGTALFYLPSRNGWREGLAVGAGMNGRGAVEIIIAEIALEAGIISREIFSILVFMAFFTTATVPFLLKWTTSWLRRRGELARTVYKRPAVLIVGAGPVARQLARALAEVRPVTLIDSNAENCEAARMEGLNALHGNAIDEQFLMAAHADTFGTVIACTLSPKINVLAARLLHRTFGAPSVEILISPGDRRIYSGFLEGLDARTFDLGSFDLPDWNHLVARGRTGSRETDITEETAIEAFIEAEHRRGPYLPLAVRRGAQLHSFRAIDALLPKDRVIGIALAKPDVIALGPLVQAAGTATIVDLEGPIEPAELLARVAARLATPLGHEPAAVAAWVGGREAALVRALGRAPACLFVEIPGEELLHLACVRAPGGVTAEDARRHVVLVVAGTSDLHGLYLRFLPALEPVGSPEVEQRLLEATDEGGVRRVLEAAVGTPFKPR